MAADVRPSPTLQCRRTASKVACCCCQWQCNDPVDCFAAIQASKWWLARHHLPHCEAGKHQAEQCVVSVAAQRLNLLLCNWQVAADVTTSRTLLCWQTVSTVHEASGCSKTGATCMMHNACGNSCTAKEQPERHLSATHTPSRLPTHS
jgi:hypothetical protein